MNANLAEALGRGSREGTIDWSAYRTPTFDELLEPDGEPRPAARRLVDYLAGLSERELAESIAPVARMAYLAGADEPPTVWAAESLALRPFVYGFRRSARGPAPLDDAYMTGADTIVRVRLAQAAARLAHLLNRTLGC